MKTIKERAEAIANDVLRKVNKMAEEDGGFVAPQPDSGLLHPRAEDQRGIDIEKACKWWESRCDNLGISRYQIELFKKAMEGGEV